jgi:hypothetical protein
MSQPLAGWSRDSRLADEAGARFLRCIPGLIE